MQNENQQQLQCDGCGKQFTSRDELQKHEKTCPMKQGTKTRTAGGGEPRVPE